MNTDDQVHKMCPPVNAVWLDCRVQKCSYHGGAGKCTNPAPAITMNENGSFVCMSKKVEPIVSIKDNLRKAEQFLNYLYQKKLAERRLDPDDKQLFCGIMNILTEIINGK